MANIIYILISVGVGLTLITIVSLLISSLSRLDTDESLYWIFLFQKKTFIWFFIKVAIPYNTITKKISREVKSAGLHVGSPGFTLISFPSVFTSMQFNDISVCY
jgi:uncharacterized membrane protein